jgi:SAM-dependent methyltransferase
MTTTVSTPICAVCGGSSSTIFCSHDRRTIRRCGSCDLLFQYPPPDRASLHQQFQSDYFLRGRLPGGNRLELEFEQWRRPALTRIVEKILRLKSSGTLLDVGCASGEIFDRFVEGSWQFYGVEPSTFAFEKAAQRFANDPRFHLFNAYLSDADFENKSFDVITILETLYYMPDPRRELSRVEQILKDDGLLVIAVPGYEYQRLRHSRPISLLLDQRCCSFTTSHLFYFSATSMRELLGRYGFRIFDVVQLGTSVYGNGLRQLTQTTYVQLAKAVSALTLGRLSLAPHVLYLCRKFRRG